MLYPSMQHLTRQAGLTKSECNVISEDTSFVLGPSHKSSIFGFAR